MSERIVLGTVQFGLDYGISNSSGKTSQREVDKILKYAWQNGIRVLDSANAYGTALQAIGIFHKNNPSIRFDVINKFSAVGEGSLRDNVLKELESIHHGQFHGYMFHSFSFYKENKEKLKELSELKNEGLIRKIGISCYTNEELNEILQLPEVDFVQLPYNMLDNWSKRGEILIKLKEANKEVHVRSVFLQGLFFMSQDQLSGDLTKLTNDLSALKDAAGKHTIHEMALNYVHQNQYIDGLVLGVNNLEQLEGNLGAIRNHEIDPGRYREIDAINVEQVGLLNPANW